MPKLYSTAELSHLAFVEVAVRLLLIEALEVQLSERRSIQINCGVDLFVTPEYVDRIRMLCNNLRDKIGLLTFACGAPFPFRPAIIKHCQSFRIDHDATDLIVSNILNQNKGAHHCRKVGCWKPSVCGNDGYCSLCGPSKTRNVFNLQTSVKYDGA